MTLTETFALVSFSIFSYADLRYRLVPGIEAFLFGTILLTLPATPLQTGIILLACGWSIFRNLSGCTRCLCCSTRPSGRYYLLDMDIVKASLAGQTFLRFPGWLVCSPCQQSYYRCLAWNFGAGFGFADNMGTSQPCQVCALV